MITGKGKAFVAGADVPWFVNRLDAKRVDDIVAFTRRGHELLQQVREDAEGRDREGRRPLARRRLRARARVRLDRRARSAPRSGSRSAGSGSIPGLGGTQRLSRRIGVAAREGVHLHGQHDQRGRREGARHRRPRSRRTTAMKAAIAELVRKGKPAGAPRRRPRVPAGFEGLARLFPAGRGPSRRSSPRSPRTPKTRRLSTAFARRRRSRSGSRTSSSTERRRWSIDRGNRAGARAPRGDLRARRTPTSGSRASAARGRRSPGSRRASYHPDREMPGV